MAYYCSRFAVGSGCEKEENDRTGRKGAGYAYVSDYVQRVSVSQRFPDIQFY